MVISGLKNDHLLVLWGAFSVFIISSSFAMVFLL